MDKTRENIHITLKPIVELQRQRPGKILLQLKEELESLLTQLKDADIIREIGDDIKMVSFLLTRSSLYLKTTM